MYIQFGYLCENVSVDFGLRREKLIIIFLDPGNNTASDEIVAVQRHFGFHIFDDDDARCMVVSMENIITKYGVIA